MLRNNKPAFLTGLVAFVVVCMFFLRSPSASSAIYPIHVSEEVLHGDVIMPKLGNETIKAELGRASWKLFHTMLARYPEKPTLDEREALKSYLHLFARLYPCGECAAHFRTLLQNYPPQTSSRESASQWGCSVHNHVNARLKKPEFDCSTIAEKYKCGCADTDKEENKTKDGESKKNDAAPIDRMKKKKEGGEEEMKLEREGLTRGD